MFCKYLKVFTKSAEVVSAMQKVALPLSLASLPHSLMCSLEGAVVGSRDLGFLFSSYAALGVLFLGFQVQ